MLEAVIFDIDGTLIDSVDLHAQAWQRAFRHFGNDVPFERVRAQIGKGADQLLPVFFGPRQLERFGKELEEFRAQLFRREYLPQVKAFPRVRELFLRIRFGGQRIFLASSAKEEEVAIYQRLMNVEDLVESPISADDAPRSKPHPDIFTAALQSAELKPDHAVVVGDTPYDAQAASKIHLRTIGMLCGGFPPQSLWDAGCIEVFRDPADLLNQYDRSSLAELQAA